MFPRILRSAISARQNERVNECYHHKFLASPEVRGQLQDDLAVVTALVEGAVACNTGEDGGQ